LGARKREIAEDMATGERTQVLAKKYHVSQGRISQIRTELQRDWTHFVGDDVSAA
jgi:Mor family transcriptional regulator